VSDSVRPVVRIEPWESIGQGVRIQRRYVDEKLTGFAYTHPGCTLIGESWVAVGPPVGAILGAVDPLTILNEIRCEACGHRGLVRHGKWVRL